MIDWNTILVATIPSIVAGVVGYAFGIRRENAEIDRLSSERTTMDAKKETIEASYQAEILEQNRQLFRELSELQAKFAAQTLRLQSMELELAKLRARLEECIGQA